MLPLENRVRLDHLHQILKERSGSDDQIAHASAAIPQVAAAYPGLELLQPEPGLGCLRRTCVGSDVKPEPVLTLTNELKVNTSVAIEKSCDVGRLRC